MLHQTVKLFLGKVDRFACMRGSIKVPLLRRLTSLQFHLALYVSVDSDDAALGSSGFAVVYRVTLTLAVVRTLTKRPHFYLFKHSDLRLLSTTTAAAFNVLESTTKG